VLVNGVAAATAVELKDSRRLRQDGGEEHVGVAWQHVRRSESDEQQQGDGILFRRQECCGWREECGRF
jgi:hypothetical protein